MLLSRLKKKGPWEGVHSSTGMHGTNLPFPKKIILKSSAESMFLVDLPVRLDTTPIQYTMLKCPRNRHIPPAILNTATATPNVSRSV